MGPPNKEGNLLVSTTFRAIFDPPDDPKNERSKYLSRLFGIFSEKIVSIWAKDGRAPYENLGRPTLMPPEDVRGHTLDFTFRDRTTGKVYVAEMKCEIEYRNFRYFVLEASCQLDHHKKPAFDAFLRSARFPDQIAARVQGRQIRIDGAILIWGAVGPEARSRIISERGFHDILSIEDICRDLAAWQNPEYLKMIGQYRAWSNRLFDGLVAADAAH